MPSRGQKTSTAPHGRTRAQAKHLRWSQMGGGLFALALSLAGATPASALLCSTASPTVVPGGTVVNSIASDAINSILNSTTTPPFLTGSTSYTLTNSQPFIAARTFVYDPSQPQANAVGSFLLPIAQLRGLTREQYLNFWALPNLPPTPRNNAVALVVVPAGTQFWSGPTGPITDPSTGLFWGTGGGLQYFVGRQVIGRFQVPTTNYVLPTPDNGGPVLAYGPRLAGNAQAIGNYLDQRCVAAYSDLDRVLTSLDVLNLANPANAAPLAAAVNQLSPDRYGALPLIIGRQHMLLLDAFGGRLDATRWPYADPDVKQQAIAPGVLAWGRVLGDFGKRDDSSTMPGYRTNTGGGLGGIGYDDGDGHVFGLGGGILSSSTNWNDLAGSTGNIRTGAIGAYGTTRYGALLIDGALTGTYSLIDVNRQIAIPDGGLGIPGLSTAISRTAYGTTEAPGFAARFDVGTNLQGNRAALKPFVGLSYSWLDRRGFSETNAGSIDLTLDDKVSDGLRSRLGAVGCYEVMAAGPFALALQGNLVWTHRLSASSGDITAGFVGQPGSFTVTTVEDDRDSLQPGLAVIGRSALGQVFARYDGDFRQSFTAHTVTAGAAFKF
jgi:Autotransporter beta-domain